MTNDFRQNMLVVVIGVALGLTLRRNARVSWARNEALPEIERLVDASAGIGGSDRWAAFELGRRAEKIIPDDPPWAHTTTTSWWAGMETISCSVATTWVRTHGSPKTPSPQWPRRWN